MNTRSKGERTKNHCTEYGDRLGYYIHNNPHLRFGTKSNYPTAEHSKDMFGLFDSVWVSKRRDNKILFVQYSSNRFHTLKPYIEWVERTLTNVLLLVWVDNVGIKSKYVTFNRQAYKVDIYDNYL